MASLDDVRRLAMALPEATEGISRGRISWSVKGRFFVWERPLGKKDVAELGASAPDGPVLGARTENLAAKEALAADPSGVYFTTSHFDGYSAILVRLDEIPADELRELVIEAWLSRAPRTLARAYARERLGRDE